MRHIIGAVMTFGPLAVAVCILLVGFIRQEPLGALIIAGILAWFIIGLYLLI